MKSHPPTSLSQTGGSPGRASSLLLGWWGCSDGVHSAGWRRPKPGARPPMRATVHCPGCEREHVVNLMWREARDGEHGDVEVIAEAAERPFNPSLPKRRERQTAVEPATRTPSLRGPGERAKTVLLDPALLGPLYVGTGTVMADPYSKLERNLVRLRVEVEALAFVRDFRGAYLIA